MFRVLIARFLQAERWPGKDPKLPALLLNSHYDVVPAMENFWTADPWAAEIKDGKIYGRGTQDMKCVCVQYLLAIERLKKKNFVPQRTVHLSFVPDEDLVEEGPKCKDLVRVGNLWYTDVYWCLNNTYCSLKSEKGVTSQTFLALLKNGGNWWSGWHG